MRLGTLIHFTDIISSFHYVFLTFLYAVFECIPYSLGKLGNFIDKFSQTVVLIVVLDSQLLFPFDFPVFRFLSRFFFFVFLLPTLFISLS